MDMPDVRETVRVPSLERGRGDVRSVRLHAARGYGCGAAGNGGVPGEAAGRKGAEMTLICRQTADIEPIADLIADAESAPESGEISEREINRLLKESRERARKERECDLTT
jgi:hypothetical protein